MSLTSTIKKVAPTSVLQPVLPYYHLGQAVAQQVKQGFPAKDLTVIGVTGTNGKTSTCFLIHRMLHEAGYKVGMMTTVAYGAGADIKPQLTHMTTSSADVLLRRIKELRAQGIEYLVLETTSHALAQYRVWGVPYSVGVLTNLTHEHISYHGTFERYRDAKLRLFKLVDKNRHGLRTGVTNADDPNGELFARAVAHPVRYGIDKGELRASDIQLRPTGVEYTVQCGDEEYHIRCNLAGSFNVYNSLAAVGVGRALGLSRQQIEQGIAALEGVEGRMAVIDEGQDFSLIVDYAHTPDSFEKLFKDMKPIVKDKLIVLFGSLGGGDTAKRPLQGELAGRYADEVVVCEEDDRQEKPEQIMEDIAMGAEKAGKQRERDLFLVHDRSEAIQFVVDRAQSGDTVLLLGKGHEKTIEHADGEHPWNESDIARQALQRRLHKL